jgi:hypothetical protein
MSVLPPAFVGGGGSGGAASVTTPPCGGWLRDAATSDGSTVADNGVVIAAIVSR